MTATQIEKLRMAAEGLILADAQKHILAHRLARKLANKQQGAITVPEMLSLIDAAMSDMKQGIELLEVSDDSYRNSPVVRGA